MLRRIGRDRVVYDMSPEHKPVLEVSPGDTVIVETEDCFCHRIVSESQTVGGDFDFSHVNPATGPVSVRGALPGDTLVVSIENIELDEQGVVETCPFWGPVSNVSRECVTEIVKIDGNFMSFLGERIEVMPMIGVIGNSPAEGSVSCTTPGSHGGNLDTKNITAGSRVYLPVFVKGGNLSLGDVHARMGDGEVGGTGVEIRAKVKLTVDIDKMPVDSPTVENEEAFYLLFSAKTLEEASHGAVKRAIQFIADWKSIPEEKAYMLTSIACDLMISQVVNPLVTVRVKVPKEIL
ncbi:MULTISPECIES: acetamidase/formamidase family protein [unclassified Mesotoga]|uniref:acetamidase/formamidase family protein n=1 Tax=unclassified Mesotoga TaxID=1184398 RepID=UPI000DA645C7|nr:MULTISPECIES: acetamidase/formamidase family protein [unclassified Mesotoga]PZC53157.1 acetamidase/formamidase [Mesotoga sp. TolDC]